MPFTAGGTLESELACGIVAGVAMDIMDAECADVCGYMYSWVLVVYFYNSAPNLEENSAYYISYKAFVIDFQETPEAVDRPKSSQQ
jgi:hypothetical protein